MQFTVFYDGACPLCMAEIKHLMRRDEQQNLAFVDISSPEFSENYPYMDKQALDARIHGQWDNGEILTGLDVTYTAWKLVGHGWLYAPLRWPVIRWFADKGYLFFAKHRHTISRWLTGKDRSCETSQCGVKND